jgi:osmotically inducible protein OsmC
MILDKVHTLRRSAPGATDGVYGLAARLNVSLPGMDRQAAQARVDAADQVCTYSGATRGNIDFAITVV